MFEAPGHDTPDLGGGQGVSNATKIVIRHARDTPQNVSGRGYTFGMKENKERITKMKKCSVCSLDRQYTQVINGSEIVCSNCYLEYYAS